MEGMQKGFGLIEGMLAVTLIAVLIIVALPAYQNYVKEANMTKVNTSYEEALRLARITFVKGDAQIALGLTSTIPKDSAGWVALLNSESRLAPGGGSAYQEVANSVTGVVGIRGDNSFVTISRPEYWDLVETSKTISNSADPVHNELKARESVLEMTPDE